MLALAVSALLSRLPYLYALAHQAVKGDFYALTVIRFAFSVLVLLAPAAFIAAVFPITLKLVIPARDRVAAGVALVYGIDTMGG